MKFATLNLVPVLAIVVARAAAAESPYQSIAAQNSFNLVSPAIGHPEAEPPPKPLPKILLTGVTDIGGKSRVFLEITEPSGALLKPILAEGERFGEIEILHIDVAKASVILQNRGVELILRLEPTLVRDQPALPLPKPTRQPF